MNSKMLVESDPHQSGIAILEEDRLTEIHLERHGDRGIVGNVYKGRVTRVLPGMQAAFVDIGLDRDAFLYVSDVGEEQEPTPSADQPDLDATHGVVPEHSQPSIDELLDQGQEILVQVVKAPLPNKGARITAQITLPGRYLVLLPTVSHQGVSRRIEDEEERERLLALIEEMAPEGGGLIVRTVGEGKGSAEFEADLAFLQGMWRRIRERAARVGPRTLVHRDLDLALRVVRDRFDADFSVLWVDGEETYTQIVEFLADVHPDLVSRVKLSREEGSLFESFSLPEQIDAALRSKVWLKSGGYIVINQTEALVAIDVNTGRFVGETNLEDTVLRTNLEAVKEVVRQIRLRDLGGIIVVDLIDMVDEEHREQVFEALEAELRRDRAKNKVLNISEFGLVEITRKRSRASLERLLTQPCPYCRGRGRIRSVSTICMQLRREVLRQARDGHFDEVLIRVHPEVAKALQTEERAVLDELEKTLSASLLLQGDSELHHERFDIVHL